MQYLTARSRERRNPEPMVCNPVLDGGCTVKLIYLVCPVAIVSVFLGLIAYYSFLPAHGVHEPAVDELTGTEISSDERFAETLEKIVASATWFTNFDRRYLRLDWSACADLEETDVDENNPSCDGLGCPGSVDVADDGTEVPFESNLGVQAARPRTKSDISG